MMTIILRHLQVLFDTLGKMAQTPLPSIMTISVLGVAIALPLMLYQISISLGSVVSQWQGNPEITVFLKSSVDTENISSRDLTDDAAIKFGQQLLEIPSVGDVKYISPEQALKDFGESSGFGDLINNLPENPLPPMLIVFPESDLTRFEVKALATQLSSLDGVDSLSFDQAWLERLSAIIDVFWHGVMVLSVLMSVGLLLIISNTVRLGIQNRSSEIGIIDQIGGTNAFIRRPFLYFGVIQGIAGALAALLITNVALYIMSKPIHRLARLYESNLQIEWTNFPLVWIVLLITAVLGWLAARLTVGNYLRKLHISVRGK